MVRFACRVSYDWECPTVPVTVEASDVARSSAEQSQRKPGGQKKEKPTGPLRG
jgi:hypothetical protein